MSGLRIPLINLLTSQMMAWSFPCKRILPLLIWTSLSSWRFVVCAEVLAMSILTVVDDLQYHAIRSLRRSVSEFTGTLGSLMEKTLCSLIFTKLSDPNLALLGEKVKMPFSTTGTNTQNTSKSWLKSQKMLFNRCERLNRRSYINFTQSDVSRVLRNNWWINKNKMNFVESQLACWLLFLTYKLYTTSTEINT